MRIKYLDYLKALAIIGVVLIHTTSNTVAGFQVDSTWWVNHFYDTFVRWCVPMFFLISGALLLASKKEESVKEFYKMKVMKIVTPFLIWSVVYFFVQGFLGEYEEELNPLTFIKFFLSGEVFGRLWFFYALLGLYMITPFLKTFVQNSSPANLKAFLWIWFLATSSYGILKQFFGIDLAIDLTYVYGYIGLYVMGYFLRKYEVKNYTGVLITLSVLSLLITFAGLYFSSEAKGSFDGYFYDYLSPHILIISVAIFIVAKSVDAKLPESRLINIISLNSLGIYLIHSLVLGVMELAGITTIVPIAFISIPLVVIVATALSLIGSMVIRRIPVVRNILP